MAPEIASMERPVGRPVALHKYGEVPPLAEGCSVAMAVSFTLFWSAIEARVRGEPGSVPPVAFCGLGVAGAAKSMLLLSVSLPDPVRCTEVAFVRAVPVRAASKLVGVLPYP